MQRLLLSAAILGALAAPAFAQNVVTCGDYTLMDNAKQMETIAAIESETSQMANQSNLTAEAIHTRLAADCQGKVDVLVIELVKGYK